MISFEFYSDIKVLKKETGVVKRSSTLYSYLNNEYYNNKRDYNYLLNDQRSKIKILEAILEKMNNSDKSVKIQLGSKEHTYFTTEYLNDFAEDREHNIIVPEDIYNTSRRK